SQGEVRISGYQTNFAPYLECEGDSCEIPCEAEIGSIPECEEKVKEKKKGIPGWTITLIIASCLLILAAVGSIIIIYLCWTKKNNIKKCTNNSDQDIEKQKIGQQANETEMNTASSQSSSEGKPQKNSIEPKTDEINQLIKKEPYQKFEPQSPPHIISSPPKQDLQFKPQIQTSISNMKTYNSSTSSLHPATGQFPNSPPIQLGQQSIRSSSPGQQPIRSPPGSQQMLRTTQTSYPSRPNIQSNAKQSYRSPQNQFPARSYMARKPASNTPGQQSTGSSSAALLPKKP
ncbi:MAG: hypothetical protein EZS28_052634, partial [Streblomastix strix]